MADKIKRKVATKNHKSQKNIDTSLAVKWPETQQAIAELETITDSDVLVFYISFNGSLTYEEIGSIYNHISNIKNKRQRLTLFLYGPGGYGVAATKIVNLIRQYYKNFEVIIPSEAASALTMLALGAEKIYMGPLSSLSPIDTSLVNHPLAPKSPTNKSVTVEITQIQKFIELANSGMISNQVDDIKKSPYYLLSEHVHPLVIGTIQRMLLLSKMLTSDILKTHLTNQIQIDKIVNELNDNFPTHGYPITYGKAKEIGINAFEMTEDLTTKSLNLLKLLNFISRTDTTENGGYQIRTERLVIIETIDLRSYYQLDKRFILDEKKSWIYLDSDGKYVVLAPKEENNGLLKIQKVDQSQLV